MSRHLPYVITGVLIQQSEDKSEHAIHYINKNLSGPSINYSHDKKSALVVVLSSQNLRHYILTWKLKVVSNSKPMHYILGRWLITGNLTWWIIILQEFDLEFPTPKTKKVLVLAYFITNLPTSKVEPAVNDTLPDEHLFLIAINDL